MNFFEISNQTLVFHPIASIYLCFFFTSFLLSETYLRLRFDSNVNQKKESFQAYRKRYYWQFFAALIVCNLLSTVLPCLCLLPILWLAIEVYGLSSVSSTLPIEEKLANLHNNRVATMAIFLFVLLSLCLFGFTTMFVASFFV